MAEFDKRVFEYIEKNISEYFAMSNAIFDRPETALNEYFACDLLSEWLERNGYLVSRNEGGLETAFKATYRQGASGPRIGLLCEYDALPMGHGCAHHMQGPIMFLASEAVKSVMSGIPYELVIYGTPGEEGAHCKKTMLENGCFQDIDVALMVHGSPNATIDIKSLAGVRLEFEFQGIAAHDSLTPELVRSGMDAMLLGFTGLEFLRGHVKDDVRLNYKVDDCPGTPECSDLSYARCSVYLRTYHDEDLPELEDRMISVMQGAAMMSGVNIKHKRILKVVGKVPNMTLNKVFMDIAREINAPQLLEFREKTGSTDFAWVTRIVPGAVFRYPFVPLGSTSHSQVFLDYGKSTQAKEGIVIASKVIAASVIKMIEDPSIIKDAENELKKYTGK